MITPEQLSKLPKWAREEFETLIRQRDEALHTLNLHVDSQTESPIYIEDHPCTGEKLGPVTKRRYIQGYQVCFEWKGVLLRVLLRESSIPCENFIDLQWGTPRFTCNEVALVPTSFQKASLKSIENLRGAADREKVAD